MTTAILVGAFILVAFSYCWWHFVEHRFTTVTRGKVYRSGAMPPGKLQWFVRRNKIRTVIDLRTPEEGEEKIAAEKAALDEIGAQSLNLQSPQVPTEELIQKYIAFMEDESNLPALIHCNHGEGRAVLYGALWQIEFEGKDPEKARKGCRMITTKGSSFDVHKVKGKFLREYQRRRL